MRCTCCDKILSDFESTRKSKTTGEYLDMCNTCYRSVQEIVPTEFDYEYDEDISEEFIEEDDVPPEFTDEEWDEY